MNAKTSLPMVVLRPSAWTPCACGNHDNAVWHRLGVGGAGGARSSGSSAADSNPLAAPHVDDTSLLRGPPPSLRALVNASLGHVA